MGVPELSQIAELWLRENGYDGLVSEDRECGCDLYDLMPCMEPGTGCQAGYKRAPREEDEVDPSCEWVISVEKPDAAG